MRIELRPLTDEDLPTMHRWLNDPGVVQWWEGDDVSWDGVVRDYGSGRTDSAEHYLAVVDGEDAGWIQCYAVADAPEEAEPWWAAGIDRTAAGIDYLVGEPSRRGQGLGSAIIRAFVDEVVFGRHPEWTQACAAPVTANAASCRALEKAGFRFVATIDTELGPSSLLAKDRP